MSEETIPLTFTAVDNLSKAVQNMTTILEKMGVVQDETSASTEKATQLTSVQAAAYDNLSKITNKVLNDRQKMMAALDIEAIGLQEVSLARKKANVEDLIAIKRVQELAKLELELAEITDEEVKAKTRLIRTTQINNSLMEEANKIVEERKNAKLEEQLKKEEERTKQWESMMAKSAAVLAVVAVGVAGATAVVSKANEAWDAQSKKLGKSASALGSIAEANSKAEKAQNKMWASLGKAIDRSGVFQSVAKAQEQTFKSLTKFINDNSEAISKFANEIGVNAAQKMQEFGKFIQENSEYVARFVLYIGNLKNAFDAVIGSVEAFALLFRTQVYGAVTIASGAIAGMLDALVLLSEATGIELPRGLIDARDSANSFAKEMTLKTVKSLEDTADAALEAGKSALEFGSNLIDIATGTPDSLKGIKDGVESIGKAAENTGKSIEKNLNQSLNGKGKRRKDLGPKESKNDYQKRLETRLALYEKINTKQGEIRGKIVDQIVLQREYYANLNLAYKNLEIQAKSVEAQIARDINKNELKAIAAEREQKLLEIALEIAAIQDPQLKKETEKLRLKQLEVEEAIKLQNVSSAGYDKELDYLTKINELVSSSLEKPLALFDEIAAEQLEKYGELLNKSNEAIQRRFDLGLITEDQKEREIAQNERLAEQEEKRLNRITKMVKGLAEASKSTVQLTTSVRAYNAAGATAEQQQDAINAGIAAGAGVLSGVTAAFIEDKKKQAAIEALINTAAAAASFADGNIPAGIAYTAAAASYGAAAVFSGGGSSGGGISGVGGGVGSTQPSNLFNTDEERRKNADAIAEAINSQRENAPLVVNVSFDNALIASDSPQAGRIISDLIRPELENIIRSGG